MDPREVAEQYLAAANMHDVDAMTQLWEPGGVENFPTFAQAHRVPEAFEEHLRSLFAAFPDVHWEMISITTDGELVAVRSRMHGTHLGPYQGVAATGKTLTVDTVDFLQIRKGKIAHNDVFFDGLASLRQIGALPPAASRRERALQKAFNISKAGTATRTVYGEATVTIDRAAKDILEFVLDLDKYREADRKFHRIHYVERHNNHGVAKYSGRLRGIPTPTDVQEWRLEPYRRLEFRSRPSLWPGMVASFGGFFECDETANGTLTQHREAFQFRPPFSWLAVPFLRTWLQRDVEDEVVRLKRLLEADAP